MNLLKTCVVFVLQAGVAPHVVPAAAPSIADALAAKFAAANASFMQAQPGLPLPAALPAGPATAAAAAAMPPEAAIDAAKLAALDAKLAQFQQAVPPASGNTSAFLTAGRHWRSVSRPEHGSSLMRLLCCFTEVDVRENQREADC